MRCGLAGVGQGAFNEGYQQTRCPANHVSKFLTQEQDMPQANPLTRVHTHMCRYTLFERAMTRRAWSQQPSETDQAYAKRLRRNELQRAKRQAAKIQLATDGDTAPEFEQALVGQG